MKKMTLAALCAAVGLSAAQAGAIPGDGAGWFVGGKTGVVLLDDVSFSFDGFSIDADFDTGWGLTVPFGYRFDNDISLAASVGYYAASLDSVSLKYQGDRYHADLDALGQTVPLMGNIAYHIPITQELGFHFGAGAGWSYSRLDIDEVDDVDVDASADDWDFAWQAFASFSYDVGPVDVNVGYRFLNVDADLDDLQVHSIEAGVTFRW